MRATPSRETMVAEALLLDRQGRAAEAMLAYKRMLERWPADPNCWYNLAVLQGRTRQFPAALASYQAALERGFGRPEELHVDRGVIYSDCLRDDAAAERELNAALALNPTYIPALLNLANLQEDLGRREAALATYQRILELDPRSSEALARFAGIRKFSEINDPLIDRLRQGTSDPHASAAERASLGFALGRALDCCGAYAAAFEAYTMANRLSRSGASPYDPALEARWFDRLIAAFPARQSSVAARRAPPHPIFVCGMFRSGSTLIEQVLGAHPRVRAGGEFDFLRDAAQVALHPFPESMTLLTPQRLEVLTVRYLAMLAQMFPGAEFVTDKQPENFMYIGLIKRLFPHAKIVHTTRQPLDNCLSIFFLHLDPGISYALDLMDIGHHYRQYLRLMAHWKQLFGADMIDVNYDAFVHQPKREAERLLAFLGLEWDERCLAPPPPGRAVKTASVWQVREPLYQRSSGRSRHYARELEELRQYLERHTPAQQRP
jgi:Sulfotransferase family/Tetratricopeptide repeat